MTFVATDEQKHSVLMDAGEKGGGDDSAFKPVDLLLAALGGCSGIDVINILRKQRQDVRDLSIEIEGIQADDHPNYFKEIKVEFVVKGKNIKKEYVERAIELSHTKYCSVGQTLEPKAKIINSYRIEEVD